jgi:CobQ-like glutamine amidotransferase family enzyme
MTPALQVAWLYPDLLNLYADRGNLLVLQHRAAARGIDVEVQRVGLRDPLPGGADLYYLGGGQDRDQARVAADLATKATGLRAAADDGAFVLGICGGLQLLGHDYDLGGDRIEGIGLLDLRTVAGEDRLVGDAVVEVDLGGGPRLLAGFENHRGRTELGPDVAPLGRVVHGRGNDGTGRSEGARDGRVLGTYLHGPLFARNTWFADWLVAEVLGLTLAPLDDLLEDVVHAEAIARAGTA